MTTVIRIVTEDSAEAMECAGNSAAWFGTQQLFLSASHFVAVDKGNRKPFFIAEIASVIPVPESGDNRWALRFNKFAHLNLNPDEYDRDYSSNPAIRRELSSFIPKLKIDEIDWQWANDPEPQHPWSFSGRETAPKIKRDKRGLTIAEAKRGLAIGLGIPEDTISISISS